MRRFAGLAVSLLALAALALPAHADFVRDYKGWRQLGPEGQAAYAMAIFDVSAVMVNDDPVTAARAAGLRGCAMSLKLNGANVAAAITKFYTDHPEAQRATPFMAFNGYLERGACSPFINEARRELGLPPLRGVAAPSAKQKQ